MYRSTKVLLQLLRITFLSSAGIAYELDFGVGFALELDYG